MEPVCHVLNLNLLRNPVLSPSLARATRTAISERVIPVMLGLSEFDKENGETKRTSTGCDR